MKINDKYFFFDVDRQYYVEVFKEQGILKVKKVTKSYIKSEFAKELKKTIPNKDEMLKELHSRLQILFLVDIESVRLFFAPNRPERWIECNYLCLNLYHQNTSKLSEKKGL